jgi:hypothetical protein
MTVDEYKRVHSISNIIEGQDFILFNIYEGNEPWNVLYDNRNGNKNIRIAKYLSNDILFEDERFGIWRMCCSDEKGIYSIQPIERFNNMDDIDKAIKKGIPNREKLLNLKEDDNPIILYFEYEE